MKSLLSKLPSGAVKIAFVAALVAALVGATTVVAKGGSKMPITKKQYNKTESAQNAAIANSSGIFSSSKHAVSNIPATTTTIASLRVPAGNYAVNAKFNYVDTTNNPTYTCMLTAGGDSDQNDLLVGSSAVGAGRNASFQVVHGFGAPGTIRLDCSKGGSASTTDTIKFIKITAIREPSLSNVASP